MQFKISVGVEGKCLHILCVSLVIYRVLRSNNNLNKMALRVVTFLKKKCPATVLLAVAVLQKN